MRNQKNALVEVDVEVLSAVAVGDLQSSPSPPLISSGPPISIEDSTVCLRMLVSRGAGVRSTSESFEPFVWVCFPFRRSLEHHLVGVFSDNSKALAHFHNLEGYFLYCSEP